jgi:hypothetical protein
MKKSSSVLIVGILLVSSLLRAQVQQSYRSSCQTSCFTTEVVSAAPLGDHCKKYELKVSYDGHCKHALSHYTVAIPCGNVKDLQNSENWKQVFGYDPKTKLTGFKIDDIPEFGDTSLKSFTISFTLCSDSEACENTLTCWEPVIAYKASTNIFYDTLRTTCPSSLKASLQKKDNSCYGRTEGELSVVVEEGKEPFTYVWSTGDSTATITGLAAGNYTVVVRDATGAEQELTATISQPQQIVLSGIVTNATCNGNANGAIDITVTGGQGSYTYTWNNGTITEDLSMLKAGSYSLTVKDSAGCTAQKTFTVANATLLSVTVKPTAPTCNQSNGAIDITVTGGVSPYQYEWSTGATSEDLQNVPAGLYKVKVTDSLGCYTELSYNLRDNNTLRLTAQVTQTSCIDDASGTINLTVTGGTSPYTFTWSNGLTTEDLQALIAGLYKVTVTDANGCSTTLQVVVSKKTFQVQSQVTNPRCYGDSTGSIVLTPSGGSAPYTYQWSNGETGNSVSGLPGGAYQVTVRDSTGCVKTLTYVISNPSAIVASASVSNGQCNAEGSFAIDLTASGGKPPYTFDWSNGGTTEDLDSLQSGTYTVLITDANGCSITRDVVVSGSSSGLACLIVQPDSIPVCSAVNNVLQASVISGATYQWSVQSSDGQWIITSGASTGSILYTAGGENTTATFMLQVAKDGCTQTCTYTVTSCASDSTGGPGGEDPGGEDPGSGDGSCDDCFDSNISIVGSEGGCTTYEVVVTTTGDCRHDLSHWDIAIPCGQLKNYWNSAGWKMEIGEDPTTGLYGLKVDDINNFGSHEGSFKVRFTVCDMQDCTEDWQPVVAYKAGQCVAYDTLNAGQDNGGVKVCAYPNPFRKSLTFSWTSDEDDYVNLAIIDMHGNEMTTVFQGSVKRGESYTFKVDDTTLRDDLYIYRYTSRKSTVYGKIMKTR